MLVSAHNNVLNLDLWVYLIFFFNVVYWMEAGSAPGATSN